jgi:DNA-binding transcriptional MerR regulator
MIRSLRALDVPLAQIAQILAGDGSEETWTLHLAALTDQRDEYDRKLQDLQRLIARREFVMTSTVIVKQIPAQLVATFRTATTHQTVFTDIPAGLAASLLRSSQRESIRWDHRSLFSTRRPTRIALATSLSACPSGVLFMALPVSTSPHSRREWLRR